MKNKSGPQSEQVKKNIQKIFREHGLDIIIECNMKVVNYLVNYLWFNPPFNLNRKAKIGKLFLNLLDKHFTPHSKLHKLFNRTNVKISYSCMFSMNSYTYMHNHKVLNGKPNEMGINNCNGHNKDTCP